MSNILKETNHDYQNCLCGNFYDIKTSGAFTSWDEFKKNYNGFAENDPLFENFDDTYHFVFRYDIYKKREENYTLELCIMLQRKGVYTHIFIKNVTESELNGEVKTWLNGRLKYLKSLWKELEI